MFSTDVVWTETNYELASNSSNELLLNIRLEGKQWTVVNKIVSLTLSGLLIFRSDWLLSFPNSKREKTKTSIILF